MIRDKDPQDRLGLQVSQVMEDQDRRETKETLDLHPALERFTLDHQDHLDLLGLKVNKASQVIQVLQGDQEALRECQLTLRDTVLGFPDHQVHQGLLDLKDHKDHKDLKDIKGTLELLVFLALQEAPSQSPQDLLVPQVLLVLQAFQAPLLPLLRCASTSRNILVGTDRLEPLDLQDHLDLQESLEASQALWKTSLLVSLHTFNVQAQALALGFKVLQGRLVLLDLAPDP